MTDLSREPDRMRLGSSDVVAMEVTQSRWPLRVPRRTRVSDMVENDDLVLRGEEGVKRMWKASVRRRHSNR